MIDNNFLLSCFENQHYKINLKTKSGLLLIG